jgi:death-on-curing protein
VTVYLSLEDLLTLTADLGVGPVRDLGLLDAAAHRPQAVLYGHPAYADVDTKAAVLLESIVRHHALADGDKRLGWLATVVFYGLNDLVLEAPDDDAYALVMAVARSEPGVEEIAAALRAWH